jgi:hypothetical protein
MLWRASSDVLAVHERLQDLYIVTARAKDRTGREDESTGAVALGTLKGDALACSVHGLAPRIWTCNLANSLTA